MTDFVTYKQDGPVATLTMNDGKVNTFGLEMMSALSDGLDRAEKEAKAVVITGRPGVLCAGFDLKIVRESPDDLKKLMRAGAELLLKSYQHPLPIIISCTGHAVAVGAMLLLTGDMRIGVTGAFRIGLNETSIGLALPTFGIALARDRLDPRQVNVATLGAHLYSPAKAVKVGYLEEVVVPEALKQKVDEHLVGFLKLNRAAYATSKRRLRAVTIASIRAGLDNENAAG